MNRMLLILLAAVWFVIAVALTAFMMYGINKQSLSFLHYDFINNFFDERNDKYADSNDKTSAGSLTVSYNADEVHDLNINLVSEKVTVKKATDSKVTVEVTTHRSEKYRPVVRLSGSTLEINESSDYHKQWYNYFRQETVVLYLPSDCQINSLYVDLVSGEVKVSSLNAKKMKLHSVSGAITADGCISDSLTADTTSGSITYDGALRSFDCHSISGAVRVALSKMLTDDSFAETVSGSVRITLPENDGFILRYDTVSGRVHDEFSGSSIGHGSGEFTYKTNGPIVSLKTVSGSISVEE